MEPATQKVTMMTNRDDEGATSLTPASSCGRGSPAPSTSSCGNGNSSQISNFLPSIFSVVNSDDDYSGYQLSIRSTPDQKKIANLEMILHKTIKMSERKDKQRSQYSKDETSALLKAVAYSANRLSSYGFTYERIASQMKSALFWSGNIMDDDDDSDTLFEQYKKLLLPKNRGIRDPGSLKRKWDRLLKDINRDGFHFFEENFPEIAALDQVLLKLLAKACKELDEERKAEKHGPGEFAGFGGAFSGSGGDDGSDYWDVSSFLSRDESLLEEKEDDEKKGDEMKSDEKESDEMEDKLDDEEKEESQ